MDAVAAVLSVTSGPDSGKTFGLRGDLVHLGRGSDSQIVLSDPGVSEHQASLVQRNGRFAIYVPVGEVVQVDGNPIPTDKWVWLPSNANLRLGGETVCRFEMAALPGRGDAVRANARTAVLPVPREASEEVNGDSASAGSSPGDDDVAAVRRGGNRKTATRTRRAASRKQVARFITDQPGEPLVRFGEDGQLPELDLREATGSRGGEQKSRERNPNVLYGVLAFSFVLTLGLLLVEPPGSPVSSEDLSEAREALNAFFGNEDQGEFDPYQLALRQALIEHSQGDFAEERQLYRKVLNMLNAADIRDISNHEGLTGRYTKRGRASDEELRRLLETLLAR